MKGWTQLLSGLKRPALDSATDQFFASDGAFNCS